LGNIWRFPYQAYENGGAAFVLAYFVLLVVVGRPMYYLEVAMGQFSGSGPVQMWNCAPICRGIGIGTTVIVATLGTYYAVIIAYSIFYIGMSLQGIAAELPWSRCAEWWGVDENCTLVQLNKTSAIDTFANASSSSQYVQGPSEQFWQKYVLQQSQSLTLESLTEYNFGLVVCHTIGWAIVFLCIIKSIKTSGKVVYFTATAPYVIIAVILVQGLMLEGAWQGISYLFVPKWDKLLEVKVWQSAAQQVFFSLGLCHGTLTTLSSYNKFHNNFPLDVTLIGLVDFLTSLIMSCAVFSVLGYLAHARGLPIDEVATAGQGLVFVVIPEALALMQPMQWLTSTAFFCMILFLGLDTEFVVMETIIKVVQDQFPSIKEQKIKAAIVACLTGFTLGLPCASSGGIYLIDLMDTYGVGMPLICYGAMEMMGLAWVYGHANVSDNVRTMVGSPPMAFIKLAWAVFSPACLALLSATTLVSLVTDDHLFAGVTPYPRVAMAIAKLACGSLLALPLAWALASASAHFIGNRRNNNNNRERKPWQPNSKWPSFSG